MGCARTVPHATTWLLHAIPAGLEDTSAAERTTLLNMPNLLEAQRLSWLSIACAWLFACAPARTAPVAGREPVSAVDATSAPATPWTLPHLSKEERSLLVALEAAGLPDPRGRPYRQVRDVLVTGVRRTVRGWILRDGELLGVDGVTYRVASDGEPADLADDLENRLPRRGRRGHFDETIYPTTILWLLALRAEPEKVAPHWTKFRARPATALTAREMLIAWPRDLLDQAAFLFSERRDDEAGRLVRHQLRIVGALERWYAKHRRGAAPEGLDALKHSALRLAGDLERRHRQPLPRPVIGHLMQPPSTADDLDALVTLLDEDRRRIQQHDVEMAQRIASHGREGVLRLLAVVESDSRLTRIIDEYPVKLVSVRRHAFHAAYNALESSGLAVPPFATLDDEVEHEPLAVAAALRAVLGNARLWQERWHDVLRDDGAGVEQWLDAADKLSGRFSAWCEDDHCRTGYPLERPLRFTARAQAARAMRERAEQLAKTKPVAACRMALAAATYDQEATRRSGLLKTLDPAFSGSPATAELVTCRGGLVEELTRVGSDALLVAYADWFAAASAQGGSAFPFAEGIDTLARFAGHPALEKSFERLFGAKGSASVWMRHARGLRHLMRSKAVRAFVLRQLEDTHEVGEVSWDTHQLDWQYDGDPSNFLSDVFGAPKPTQPGKRRFRACDAFARNIALLVPTTTFSLTWDAARADAALPAIRRVVQTWPPAIPPLTRETSASDGG